MVNNVNTNPGALVALQNLTRITGNIQEVQRRVSTGLQVSSAKDNPALFSLAQQQRAELGSIESVQQALRIGVSTTDVALAAARQRASQAALHNADAAEAKRADQREMVRGILERAVCANTRLSITRGDSAGAYVYRAIDVDSGDIVREWPPE